MRQRRRAERGYWDALGGKQGVSRWDSERLKQRLLIWAGAAVAVILLAVLAVGFYTSSYSPPRRTVAQVDTEVIRLRDLVPAARILNSTVAGGAGIQAQQVFNLAVGNEVLSRAIADLGIEPPNPGEIEAVIARLFEPAASDPDGELQGLGAVGQQRYDDFLTETKVTDAQYRDFIAGDLARAKVTESFQALVAIEDEAVLLSWIVAPNSVDAQTARERIDAGEAFATVAAEVNIERAFSGATGEVGWVPRGAFPEFDETIFTAFPGTVFGPINSSLGFVLLQVNDGPRLETISERVRELVVDRDANSWFTLQYGIFVTDIDFGLDAAQWLIDHAQ